jgi:hypothetical protein
MKRLAYELIERALVLSYNSHFHQVNYSTIERVHKEGKNCKILRVKCLLGHCHTLGQGLTNRIFKYLHSDR